jgi:type IV pilus assembly protein PilM
MLRFVQSWFATPANPIGVDFGSDCLRMAQVENQGGEMRLVAAASADVPHHVRQNPAARAAFFAETVKDLLNHGNFRGRRAVLALPAASMYIQHLRLPKLDDAEMKKALPFEAAGKIPIDPAAALMRHLVAGEVYQDQEPKNEVILMAANRELVNQLLQAAARARLDVVGMSVEPKAIVDCFGHVYRRKVDVDVTSCFVDIGSVSSRAVVARGSQILFARVIPVGGDHFSRAVADALKISFDDAKILRIKLAHQQPAVAAAVDPARERLTSGPDAATDDGHDSFALLSAGMAAAAARITEPSPTPRPAAGDDQAARAEAACRPLLAKLVEELDLCRRYHESVFPNKPVDRLIFIGGEARHRSMCQHVARVLGLAAQVGDPLVRLGRTTDVGVESGIDRRQPQPAWAVALGLSMGAAEIAETETSTSGAAETARAGT